MLIRESRISLFLKIWNVSRSGTTQEKSFESLRQLFPTHSQPYPMLCNSMDCSPAGFPALRQLAELVQTCGHWVDDAIQPSHPLLAPFFSCPWSSPSSGSFPMSQLLASGGQSIRASALASILPMNIQDWFPLGLAGLISLLSKGLSRVFSNTTVQKINALLLRLLHGPPFRSYLTTGKVTALTI